VSADQRQRVRAAMIDLVLERGYPQLTVPALCARAGISAAAFDRLYADLSDCFLQVYNEEVDRFLDRILSAYEGPEHWRDKLRAAAYALARFIRENPSFVRFGTVGTHAAGDLARARRDEVLQLHVDLIDAGRQELDDPDSIARSTAESVIGSVFLTLSKRASGGSVQSPEQFVPDFMYIAVRPYLGHELALEELSIPPPPEDGDRADG
jgi:AcrR family transcriptional regulator